jgi:prepilin peptidase CpaA
MPEYLFPSLFLFACILLFAAAIDLFTLTIPNRVSLALLAAFLLNALVRGIPLSTMIEHLAVGIVLLAIGFTIFARGWIGGGDAKLLACIGLWVGPEAVVAFISWTAILGGYLAALFSVYRRITPPLWIISQPWAMRLHNSKEGIPYGVALAGAGLLVYPKTVWMAGLPS